MDAWLGDTLRQVSSQELGHDEFSTQTLARKQREVEEEIQSHRPVIDSLQEQVLALPEAFAQHPQVREPAGRTIFTLECQCSLLLHIHS